MIDFIFKESSPILRIVFDLGGIQKSEIEKRLKTEIDKNNRQMSKINDNISNYQKDI